MGKTVFGLATVTRRLSGRKSRTIEIYDCCNSCCQQQVFEEKTYNFKRQFVGEAA